MCNINYFPEKSPLKRLPANPATAELPEGFLPLPGFELVDVLVAPKSPPSKEVRFELPISPPSNEPIAFAEEPEVCCPNRLMKSGATAINIEPVYSLGETMQKAGLNTVMGILIVFAMLVVMSGIINEGKVILEHILYGTLSGAVIISGCCSVCLYQWAALILGTVSAVIAVIILAKIKPVFMDLGLRDCCNVLIIHGIFGILGGFITPMFISGLDEEDVKEFNLYYDTSRKMARQAGIQVGGLFITIGISFVGGIATGFLMKVSTCNELKWLFHDSEFFGDFIEDDGDNNKLQGDDDEDKGSQPSYN